jgi:hypothetical protein
MEDLLTPVLSCWTAQMNSDSPTFEISCPTHPLFFWSDFLQNGISYTTRPFQRTAGMTSRLRPSEILMTSHFGRLGVTSLRTTGSDDTCPSGLDDSDLFWLLTLRESLHPSALTPLECGISHLMSLTDGQLRSSPLLRTSWFFEAPHFISSRVNNILTHIPVDGRFRSPPTPCNFRSLQPFTHASFRCLKPPEYKIWYHVSFMMDGREGSRRILRSTIHITSQL